MNQVFSLLYLNCTVSCLWFEPRPMQQKKAFCIVQVFRKRASLFFVYFRSFQANSTIFTTNKCDKYASSIWRRDSNPWPLKHESSPITTRPGLPPSCIEYYISSRSAFSSFLFSMMRRESLLGHFSYENDRLKIDLRYSFLWRRSKIDAFIAF